MPNTIAKITSITARQILDSRDQPTIEVEISAGGIVATASVPSGKSTGSGEAVVLRDHDGGMKAAIKNIETIVAPKVIGQPVDSEEIDHILLRLDMTKNKHALGGNVTIGVSQAAMRLEALVLGIPLWKLISTRSGFSHGKPLLYMNTLNGGIHADFCMPFQEYILAVGGETLAASNRKAKDIFQTVKEKLDSVKNNYFMGDEGGFATTFNSLEEPFQMLTECISGDKDIFIAIDAAASELYKDGKYNVLGKLLGREELFDVYKKLTEQFDLRSIEDPFDEKDFVGFEEINRWFQGEVLIVGDDLTTTNPLTVRQKAASRLANAVIIKPNQIGTMFETFEAIKEARKADWKVIVSHRSGETVDSFIADLAVGVGAYGIKAGAHTQPERLAKYTRLLEIEKEMPLFPPENKIRIE